MSCHLFVLPNELLHHTLDLLTSRTLLEITPTCHRIHVLVLRILHNRLQAAPQLPEHTLLLECYHPSAKLTEPPLYCSYVGTSGLDKDDMIDSMQGSMGKLGIYKNLYSSFRPQRRSAESYARRVRHPAGDVPGSRTHPSSSSSWMDKARPDDAVRQLLSLDSHELFTQLVASLNLARKGPRNGLFFSFVEIDDGVLRVWREWLKKMNNGQANERFLETVGKGKATEMAFQLSVDTQKDERILWIDSSKKVGLRFKVCQKKWRRDTPILLAADEEVAVSYEVEYEGTTKREKRDASRPADFEVELLVRTSHLALTLEESLLQQGNQSGKAVVFGSFR